MADFYNTVKYALLNQIKAHLVAANEQADVYPVYYQNIPFFPAVAIQTERRKKVKKGVSKISEVSVQFNVWTYVKIADFEDAEAECLRLTEIVEAAIENDKTLGGITMYLTLDDDLEFGVVESNDGIFLQGSKILLTVTKRVQG